MTNPIIGCIFVKQYKQGINHITVGSHLKRIKNMTTQNTNTMNQKLVELSRRYDSIQKERAEMDMRGENSYHLYQEIIVIEKEIKSLQEKRDSLISK